MFKYLKRKAVSGQSYFNHLILKATSYRQNRSVDRLAKLESTIRTMNGKLQELYTEIQNFVVS